MHIFNTLFRVVSVYSIVDYTIMVEVLYLTKVEDPSKREPLEANIYNCWEF